MRLTFKLVSVFMLANIALAVVYGYLAVQREIRLFRESTHTEAHSLGKAMEGVLAQAFQSTGRQAVLECVRRANAEEEQLRIRWVWFDLQPGADDAPSAPREELTAISIERHLTIEAQDPAGGRYLHVYWPVKLQPDRPGGLEFSRPMAKLDQQEREIIRRTALLVGEMVLLSGILAAVLGLRFVGGPLRQLMEKIRRVAAGDLQGPVHVGSRDELAELAEGLNGMCEQLSESQSKVRKETAARIAAMEQLRHADRLQTVGRMAAGIAHELGTPLNVVSGRAELIASGKLSPDETRQSAAAIKTEAARMTKIIREVLDFARPSKPHKASVDLRQVVRQTMDLLGRLAEERNVRLCFAPDSEPATAEVDVGQIQQVLINLIMNAVQAMPQGGKAEVAVGRTTARPPGQDDDGETTYFSIEVRDEGVGIPEQNLPHLFEPFFTTKDVGEGAGLGLSISYGIVQEHGGWIDVTSRPGEGSCFTVYLPQGAPP
jgi:signal transduction histidine kinase